MAAVAVAEEAGLVVRAEEARCGVAAAPTGCQGEETHVSSAARVRVPGRCRLSEVSAGRWETVSQSVASYFLGGQDLKSVITILQRMLGELTDSDRLWESGLSWAIMLLGMSGG